MIKKQCALTLLVLMLAGCATGDWEEATKRATARDYINFLTMHPRSEFSEEARKRIANLEQEEWDKAMTKDDLVAYAAFYSTYPNTKYLSDFKVRVERVLTRTSLKASNYTSSSVKRITQQNEYLFTMTGQNISSMLAFMPVIARNSSHSGISEFKLNTTDGPYHLMFLSDPTAPLELRQNAKDRNTCDLIYVSGTGLIIASKGGSKVIWSFNVP